MLRTQCSPRELDELGRRTLFGTATIKIREREIPVQVRRVNKQHFQRSGCNVLAGTGWSALGNSVSTDFVPNSFDAPGAEQAPHSYNYVFKKFLMFFSAFVIQ